MISNPKFIRKIKNLGIILLEVVFSSRIIKVSDGLVKVDPLHLKLNWISLVHTTYPTKYKNQ